MSSWWRHALSGATDPLLGLLLRRLDHLSETQAGRRARAWSTADPTAVFYPTTEIVNLKRDRGSIVVGAHSHVRGQLLTFAAGGHISIGEWTYVGEGSRIWSEASVLVGSHVLIAHLVDIHDTDSHPLDWGVRRLDAEAILSGRGPRPDSTRAAPVLIEDDVWIGFKASVLKGVRIGRGSIVAAGSMVTKDVAPWTLVAGNPARTIRELAHAG